MEIQDRIAAPSPAHGAAVNVGALRLAVGLAQGVFLYFLLDAAQAQRWPSTHPLLFTPLVLVGLFKPAVVVSSLGSLSRRQLQLWAATVAVTVAALGVYAVWRMGEPAAPPPQTDSALPWAPLAAVLVPWCFIAHALVMAGVADRRRIASYPSYFETAWKLIVQLAFSAGFVGALWLILLLGSQLFLLVQLSFLAELLHKPWFALPVTVTAWTCAMHVTDVRPAIVRGIRNLLLTLLSWILPVMTLLVGAFLLTLPFTGLAPLWATRHASAELLAAAGAFVVLINAAWQEGGMAVVEAPLAIRLSMRIASLLLVPVTAIAGYALALRVGAYGWTSDRVIAAACVLVAACYSLGYAGAALRDRGLTGIARVNIATALVVLATVLALLSPLADPVRLAVNSQVARLESGKVAVDQFDFAWLRFSGQRYGQAALARLDANASGAEAALLRSRIAEARALKNRFSRTEPATPVDVAANVRVWPKGAKLPDSFLHEKWQDQQRGPNYPVCLWQAGQACDAVMLDLTGDGKVEIMVVGEKPFSGGAVFGEDEQGHWRLLGNVPMELAGCSLHEALKAGHLQVLAPTLNDVEIAGQRIHFESARPPIMTCPPQPAGK
ncbi:DUF4153 domain-containing protein [Massilia terrae]|uniref:DUF4153 domain-containing protein n=1 Tax=Massilia terrae TaxID=1811224 RepID=A0ABT2CXH5_9BURK|nr:DUF4153 domain-containing protein [Massilia terrae]MCS0658676.1 DUF4153 domain-containing protein [Massilia terrae]